MAYKIYANKKTKIAHRAGKRGDACRQTLMLGKNVVRFDELFTAERKGYRACKRCRPE